MTPRDDLTTRAYNGLQHFLEELDTPLTIRMIKDRLKSDEDWQEFARTPNVGKGTLLEVKEYIGYPSFYVWHFGWIGSKPPKPPPEYPAGRKAKLERAIANEHTRTLKSWARQELLQGALSRMTNLRVLTNLTAEECEALKLQYELLKKFFKL